MSVDPKSWHQAFAIEPIYQNKLYIEREFTKFYSWYNSLIANIQTICSNVKNAACRNVFPPFCGFLLLFLTIMSSNCKQVPEKPKALVMQFTIECYGVYLLVIFLCYSAHPYSRAVILNFTNFSREPWVVPLCSTIITFSSNAGALYKINTWSLLTLLKVSLY